MILRTFMRAKIHGALVTGKDLHYTGSLGVDKSLMDAVGMVHGEQVQVINLANGERMWTYLIDSPDNSGEIVLNGGMAHKGEVGDQLLLITYAQVDEASLGSIKPKVALMGDDNHTFELRDG